MNIDWRNDAACLGMDVNIFFPDPKARSTEARAICDRCPVKQACLTEHFLEPHGVFGGLTPEGRVALRRGGKKPRPKLSKSTPETAPCGTTKGYTRHQAHGEKPCRDCLDAKAAYRRRCRAEKNAAKQAAA